MVLHLDLIMLVYKSSLTSQSGFRKEQAASLVRMPCLHDRYAEGGTTKNEYSWQDL